MRKTKRPRSSRRSEAEIRRILTDMDTSPLSQRAFAATRGIPLSTLTTWRRRLARRGSSKDAVHAGLVPVVVTGGPQQITAHPEQRRDPFEVRLSSGHVLHLAQDFDPASLRRLLSVLDGPC